MPRIPFATQIYKGRSSKISSELVENLYVETAPQSAKSPVTLVSTPGLKPRQTVGTGPIRGMVRQAGYLWVVSGNELYRVANNGSTTLVGAISGYGPVYMIADSSYAVIVTDGAAYYATATSLNLLPESHLVGAAYQDGYGIYAKQRTNQWVHSDVGDLSTLPALNVAQKAAYTDNLRTVFVDHRTLWLMGEETIERWYNAGLPSPGVAFARDQGGFMERGCAAAASVAKMNNQVYWLGNDLRVYRNEGYVPVPISTSAVDYLIGQQTGPDAARGWTYQQEGRSFYVLTFPSGITLVFDATTNLWHKRVSDGLDRWRVECHQYIWNKHIVGDYSTGDLYELDLNTYDENSAVLRRRAITPPIHAGENRLICNRFELDMETGVGLMTGQGSDPQVMLDWTDNETLEWAGAIWRSVGATGKRKHKVVWHNLGMFDERSFRVTISDPVPVRILGAYADFTELSPP